VLGWPSSKMGLFKCRKLLFALRFRWKNPSSEGFDELALSPAKIRKAEARLLLSYTSGCGKNNRSGVEFFT
jgi:hypothetical protein